MERNLWIWKIVKSIKSSSRKFIRFEKTIESGIISGTADEISLVKKALPIIQERIVKLAEIPAMLNFLFVKDFQIATDEKDKVSDSVAKKVLTKKYPDLQYSFSIGGDILFVYNDYIQEKFEEACYEISE